MAKKSKIKTLSLLGIIAVFAAGFGVAKFSARRHTSLASSLAISQSQHPIIRAAMIKTSKLKHGHHKIKRHAKHRKNRHLVRR